jgi:hypothetical protein
LHVALDLYDRQGIHLFGRTSGLPDILPAMDGVGTDTRRIGAVLKGLPLAEGPLTMAVSLQRPAGATTETIDRQETMVEIERNHLAASRGMLRLDSAWDWETPSGVDVAQPPGIRLSRWSGR